MLLEQEQAIQKVERGVTLLSDTLVDRFDIEEDVALDIIRDIPNLVDRVQDDEFPGLLREAVTKARHPKRVVMSGPDPDEMYAGHRTFVPRITTKSTYNEHMAQSMTPYVKAIAEKVAEDRGVAAPDTKTIEAVLRKTDWARAAYDAKSISIRNPSKVRNFVAKYLVRPIDAVAKHGTAVYAILMGAMSIRIVLALFRSYKTMERMAGAAGSKSMFVKKVETYSKFKQKRAQRSAWKRAGYGFKARPPYKVY